MRSAISGWEVEYTDRIKYWALQDYSKIEMKVIMDALKGHSSKEKLNL